MKRFLLALCCSLATLLFATVDSVVVGYGDVPLTWTDPETGITWYYTRYARTCGDIYEFEGNVSLGWASETSPAISTSYSGPLVVPSTINGISVDKLNNYAFYGCSSLTSIVLPEGITSLGSSAFSGCSSLTSVVIPEGVTSIGSEAFRGCSSLTSVVIPEGVTDIGYSAFSGCSSLTSVVIPEGVTSIEASAFSGCSSLTSVVIPVGVTSIGSYAFRSCSSLTSVVIPEGVTAIEDHAFSYCFSLTSVVIPVGVTAIGNSAFEGCTSLTSVVIPVGVTSIGRWAFDGCYRLKEVTFLGDVPEGWGNVPSGTKISFSQAYAGKWNAVLSAARRGTVVETLSKAGVTVSAEMTTPKTMRVTYAVKSEQPTVKVRAVAWKDGVRSFANIVPVKTAAEGSPEAVPNGGEVTTGVEHTFVWQVSANWATDLDKVAMEILVEEGTLLPQEKITIPALNDHPEMTITRNGLASGRLFDALVWCYAEGDEALVVTDGVVKVNGTAIANGARLPDAGDWNGGSSWSTAWKANATALLNYLYGKMGYKVLAGEDLTWARAATRLELANSGLDQVSVKITEE